MQSEAHAADPAAVGHPGGAAPGTSPAPVAPPEPGYPPPVSGRRRYWVLAACCAVAFARQCDPRLWMMGLDIPDAAFGAGWQPYRLFSTVTMLLLLACLIAGGLLGDIVGRRRVLLWGSAVSTLCGYLTMLAPNLPLFALTRSVDAAAGALAFPLTLAVLRLTFAGRERALAILAYTVVAGGAMLAAFLAVILEEPFGWRSTLVLPALVGTAGTYLVWRYVGESRAPAPALRPAATAAGWALALLPFTLCAVAARLSGSWVNPVTLTGLGLAVLGFLLLGMSWRGRFRAEATAGLTDRRRHQLSVMLLAGATLSFGLTGYALQLYGYFTVVQGYGAIRGGVALAPLLALVLLTLRRSAALVQEWEARRLIAAGLLLMGVAAAGTAFVLPLRPPYWLLVLPLALFGYGCVAAQTAWTNAFMSAMPGAVVGASAGIMRATASTGAAFGGAVLGTVLLFAGRADLAGRLKDAGLAADQLPAAKAFLDALLLAGFGRDRPAPGALPATQALMALYSYAFTSGVAATLLLTGAACVAMAILVWIVLAPTAPAVEATPIAQSLVLESPL